MIIPINEFILSLFIEPLYRHELNVDRAETCRGNYPTHLDKNKNIYKRKKKTLSRH